MLGLLNFLSSIGVVKPYNLGFSTNLQIKSKMGLLKTLIGATVGGIVGGPLGMIAGAAIVNDPSVADGVTQHDE